MSRRKPLREGLRICSEQRTRRYPLLDSIRFPSPSALLEKTAGSITWVSIGLKFWIQVSAAGLLSYIHLCLRRGRQNGLWCLLMISIRVDEGISASCLYITSFRRSFGLFRL